jgi:hypothetical protein
MACLRRFSLLSLLFLWVSLSNAQVTFTTIDVPGAGFTGVEGINTAGDMVGYYGTNGSYPAHAFVLRDGNFTFFDQPGSSSTSATGINDSGLIVGYADAGSHAVGFMYDEIGFTPIRYGNSGDTFPIALNNAREVVGSTGTLDGSKGFVFRRDHFRDVNFPGGAITLWRLASTISTKLSDGRTGTRLLSVTVNSEKYFRLGPWALMLRASMTAV